MGMSPCYKCLENDWSFENIEDIVRATCNQCGHEVEFENKYKKKMKVGDICKKCGVGIIYKRKSKFKKKKLLKSYYYTDVYRCDKCKTSFMSDEFKVINNV